MNYLYGRNLNQYPYPAPQQQYNAYATTFDFKNPSTGNVQSVLKESWPLFGLAGAAGILLGVTKLVPWGSSTLQYITGGLLLAGAGYGYMLSKKT